MLQLFIVPIFELLTFIINFFPSGTGFPSAFHTAFTSFGGYIHILDPLVPISVLLTCVTTIFTVEIAIFGFKFFRWVFSHVPQIGGN